MKKNNLLKVVGLVILTYCLLTWIIPASYFQGELTDLGRYQISLLSLFQIPLETISYFSYIFVFILTVGAFYGVLKKTTIYDKFIGYFTEKFKKKEKIFLIAVIVLFAIISSVAGLELGLFFLYPFIISVVLALGYDKFTALAITLGSTIIGMFGSTYSSTMYTMINSNLGITDVHDNIITKVVLLVLGIVLLTFFTLQHANKVKKEVNNKNNLINKEAKKGKLKDSIWPALIMIIILLLLFILGTTNFVGMFKFDWFAKAHDAVLGFTIKDFPIFNKLFSGVNALGTWIDPVRYTYYALFIIISTLIMALIYRVKLDDTIDGIMEGVKDYFKTALTVIFAYTILIIVTSFPAIMTIEKWILTITESFNIVTYGITTMLSGILHVDIYYFPQYYLPYIASLYEDSVIISLISVMTASLYSLAMLIAPTGMLLLASLSITDTTYKEWLKFIWKLFVSLLVVALIVFTIVLLV